MTHLSWQGCRKQVHRTYTTFSGELYGNIYQNYKGQHESRLAELYTRNGKKRAVYKLYLNFLMKKSQRQSPHKKSYIAFKENEIDRYQQ